MLTEEKTIDRVEAVYHEETAVQVREVRRIFDGDALISQSYHRRVIESGDDYSGEPANVVAICTAAFADSQED